MRRVLGWDDKEIEFEGTIEDLLKSLTTLQGETLYQVLILDGKIKDGYLLSVNGRLINSIDLNLQPGDRVMMMDLVRLFHGG
ncbi:MAG: MoaD/ThiS family protein [Candidatus Anstonellales archaeon]